MAPKKNRLGRGLDSLITGGISKPADSTNPQQSATPAEPSTADAGRPAGASASGQGSIATAEQAGRLREIPVNSIDPNPDQPRTDFNEDALDNLCESIRSEGLQNPISVKPSGARFMIISGERRWRAFRKLGYTRIEAIVHQNVSDVSVHVKALIENLQRENLNPMEEARGYARLKSDFKLTQEAIAERVGKSRSKVANMLRLLQLSKEVQGFLSSGQISEGHAKLLLALESHDEQNMLARRIIENGMSVRETERLIENHRKGQSKASRGTRTVPESENTAIKSLEKQMASFFNTPVSLAHNAKKGKIVIEYYGNEDLQRILEIMGVD